LPYIKVLLVFGIVFLSEKALLGCNRLSDVPEKALLGCNRLSDVPERALLGCNKFSGDYWLMNLKTEGMSFSTGLPPLKVSATN